MRSRYVKQLNYRSVGLVDWSVPPVVRHSSAVQTPAVRGPHVSFQLVKQLLRGQVSVHALQGSALAGYAVFRVGTNHSPDFLVDAAGSSTPSAPAAAAMAPPTKASSSTCTSLNHPLTTKLVRTTVLHGSCLLAACWWNMAAYYASASSA